MKRLASAFSFSNLLVYTARYMTDISEARSNVLVIRNNSFPDQYLSLNLCSAMKTTIAKYKNACKHGLDWLLQHVHDDGSTGPVASRLYYYRVPWMYVLMGEYELANRKLDWIKAYMFTSEGAFEGLSPQQIYTERYGSYPLSCLIAGAILTQRFDIVYPGVENLKTWQDEHTGGVNNSKVSRKGKDEQELFPTAQFGMTMLLSGQLKSAIKAGDWMERVWRLQPDSNHLLYHVYDSDRQRLVIDVDPADTPLYITRKDLPWQHHFNGGIAAAFLTHLYFATHENKWLDLARKYQNFSMTTDACQFKSMQVCKSGSGSGLLYQATGDPIYRAWTKRIGDWFLSHQHADGHWENTRYWNPNPTLADNIEITTEFIMHLAHISMYLSLDRAHGK
jgi:hypothetical protein